LSHHEETRELSGKIDNARNNARCPQERKTTHGLDGEHQDVDRTPWEESIRMTGRGREWKRKKRKWKGGRGERDSELPPATKGGSKALLA